MCEEIKCCIKTIFFSVLFLCFLQGFDCGHFQKFYSETQVLIDKMLDNLEAACTHQKIKYEMDRMPYELETMRYKVQIHYQLNH